MINLLHGDCLDLMGNIPDKSVDLTVTSPPYDNLRTYNNKLVWNWDIFTQIADHLFRVTKKGGVVVWVAGDATINGSETGTSFKQVLFFKEIGFNLHDTMIYAKNNYIPLTHNRYEQQFEYAFIVSRGKPKTFNPIMKKNKQVGKIKGGTFCHNGTNRTPRHRDVGVAKESIRPNIWFYNVGRMNSTKDIAAFNHPAIFPEKLAHDHIISWSNEGDTVLDPMMGSGTTGKMAKLLNRRFIGIEKDADYFKIAMERIESETKQLKLFKVA